MRLLFDAGAEGDGDVSTTFFKTAFELKLCFFYARDEGGCISQPPFTSPVQTMKKEIIVQKRFPNKASAVARSKEFWGLKDFCNVLAVKKYSN